MSDKELKAKRKEVIKKYMDGNLYRFLRKHQKQAIFEAVYYDYIRPWKKDKVMSPIVKQMIKKLKWPRDIVNVVNIMRTLNKHYEYKFGEDCARVAWEIYKYFENDIANYNQEKYFKYISVNGYEKWPKLSPNKALKEQKARGFIKAIDFDDFDRKACHVVSIVDSDYIYPMNFYIHQYPDYHKRKRGPIQIYIGQFLTGVSGYTKALVR